MSGGAVILMAQTVGRRTASMEVWDGYNADDLETLEESLREIRRALFSVAVSRMRRQTETEGIPDDETIVAEIDQSRKERDLRRRSEPKD